MATQAYLSGRRTYVRPQAMIFADGYTSASGFFVPEGNEFDDFIILSDHNRKEIDVKTERIENRKRMVNGRMRSYHIADKESYSVQWDMLPSRAFNAAPTFDSNGIQSTPGLTDNVVDLAAGGQDLKAWYDSHGGDFWLLLSYDAVRYGEMAGYVKAVKVFFSSFNYSIVKRGTYDLWNVSLDLEEA